MAYFLTFSLSVFSCFVLMRGVWGEICTKRFGLSYINTYCQYGCCGTVSNQYCCINFVGVAVGCAMAGIAFVFLVVAVICFVLKTKGHSGRVVSPATWTATSHTNTGAHYSTYPTPTVTFQPPPYIGKDQPPPPYTYDDPAYPPNYNQPPESISGHSNRNGHLKNVPTGSTHVEQSTPSAPYGEVPTGLGPPSTAYPGS